MTILMMMIGLGVVAQDSTICFITYVKGEVLKPTGEKLQYMDKVYCCDIPSLKYKDNASKIILYYPDSGSITLRKDLLPKEGSHEGLMDFLRHLFKLQGKKVSLSSRGDCVCLNPQACFSGDPSINEKVLMVDSLSFGGEETFYADPTAYYFLQCRQNGVTMKKNGKPWTNKLRAENGVIIIKPENLVFSDSIPYNPETDELWLGLATKKDGVAMPAIKVASFRAEVLSSAELESYYNAVKETMPAANTRDIYKKFCNDIYVFFGKPNVCQLNYAINYHN